MFKKFKDKLAEEMKQSPARLQASMQQLAQAVVSPSVSNTSIQSLSASNDNFSLTEEGDETPKNSPSHQGFQSVDLTSPNSVGVSRRSSISSVTSAETGSSLFPIYEGPSNMYHLQSDMDQSASEADESISPNLERVTKEQVYSAYRKVQSKYHKYRGRYTDLATHYREMERVKSKLENVLVETQDKALRRIADLKEQCQLEQQAKAHLEEALRNDIEEKDHVIGTLNTKVMLLQSSTTPQESPDLLDLSSPPEEDLSLKSKCETLEALLTKCKESLKRSKEKISELTESRALLEHNFDSFKIFNSEKFRFLEDDLSISKQEVIDLRSQIDLMKKREEESAISLAENKLSIHQELEVKESQIKKLNDELKSITEANENLSMEIEKLSAKTEENDIEKIRKEMQGKLIELEEKMGSKHHEELLKNEKLREKIELLEQENEEIKKFETDLLRAREELEKSTKIWEDEKLGKDEMINSLNSKIQIYTNAVQKAKEKIELQNEKIKDLMENSGKDEEKLDEKNVELLGIKSELKSCKSTITDLKNAVKNHSVDNEQLKKEKNCLIANILDYKKRLNELKKNCENVKSVMDNFAIEKSQEISEVENIFTQKLNGLKIFENFEEITREKENLISEIAKKNIEIEEMKKLPSIILEKDKTISEMLEKVNSYDEVVKKNCKLMAEIDNLNFNISDIGKLTEQLKSTKLELAKSAEQLEKQQKQQLTSSEELTNELMRLKEFSESEKIKFSEILEKCKNLEFENGHLKTENEEIIKIRTDSEHYKELLTKNVEISNELKTENSNLKTELDTIKSDFQNFKSTEISSLKSEISKLENLVEVKSLGFENLEKKNSEQNEELLQIKDQLEMTKNLLEESQDQTKNLKIQIEKFESIKSENENHLKNLKTEEENHKKTAEKLNNLEENLSQMTSDCEAAKEIVHQNEEKLTKITENNTKMENEILSLKDTLNSKNELIEKLKNLKNKQTKAIQDLESKNESLRALEALTKAQEEESLEKSSKLSEILAEKDELSSKISELLTENSKLQAQTCELASLQQNLEAFKSKSENDESEINQLKAVIASSQTTEKAHITEMQSLQELSSTLKGKALALESELASRASSHNEEIQKLQETLDTLKVELSSSIDESSQTIHDRDKRIKELMDKESWTNQMLEELRLKTEKLESDIELKCVRENTEKIDEKIEDERLRKLVEQLQSQLQNMESKLITSQAKESQLEILNEELNKEIGKLRELMETAEVENGMRMSQLVKELQAQLRDKDGQLQAALDKNFDKQQGYESELVQQYREQLRDFQVELTTKSEEIESFREDRKEVQKLIETIANIKREHANEITEMEKKWRTMKVKNDHLEEMENHWQKDKLNDDNVEENNEELENMSRVAMAAVQSNTGSFHSLQQTLVSQRRELSELRKIVKLRHDALEDSTEIEYLRNILYEYMMGRETLVLARVIAAVVKFDQDQTNKILKKEEDKLTLLGSLGLS